MEYLYHQVPKNMDGTVLYPLNVLKETRPEIYAEHVKKYAGREKLLNVEVPPLKCLWNDVLHFTAVAPNELKKNLATAGIEMGPVGWYKIPTTMIEGENSTAFVYPRDVSFEQNFKEYENFNPQRMEIYKKVLAETIEYYKEKQREGIRPLLFHLVPHVLYRGTVDVSGLEIVTA